MSLRWRTILAAIITLVLCFAARHFKQDDALIYARYVRNLLTGHGLVFNVGERVNALTSPLHTLLLASLSWLLRGNVLAALWILGTLFLLATVVLAERYAPYAGMLIGASVFFEKLLGMETSLFVFLLLLTVVAYGKKSWNWLPLLLCLTALCRFEAGALAVVVGWQMVRHKHWPRWWALLPVILLVMLYFGAEFHFYGKLLPSSGTAKILQGRSGYWGRWPRAFLHVPRDFWYPLRSLFYVVPLALWLDWRGVRTAQARQWNAAVLPFLSILLAFYVLFNITGYLWYYAPFGLFILVYAALGLPRSRLAGTCLAIVLLHMTILGIFVLRSGASQYQPYRNLANWLNANTAPGASIATVETGTLGWYAGSHPIIDIVGLTTPRNAVLIAHRDRDTWLAEDRPDYVVIHTPAALGEGVAVASKEYRRLPQDFDGIYLMQRVRK